MLNVRWIEIRIQIKQIINPQESIYKELHTYFQIHFYLNFSGCLLNKEKKINNNNEMDHLNKYIQRFILI